MDEINARLKKIAEEQKDLEGELRFLQEESKLAIGKHVSSLLDAE